MSRQCAPCAEPGCGGAVARGSYCAACGDRYYVAPRGRAAALAAAVDRWDRQGISEPLDFDTLDDGLRAQRAARRVAAVRNGG